MSDQNARLAERVREVGLERIVCSTDWPFWPPGEVARQLALAARLGRWHILSRMRR